MITAIFCIVILHLTNIKLNKRKLAIAISKRAKIRASTCEKVLDGLIPELLKEINKGGTISIRELGRFERSFIPTKHMRNIASGEPFAVASHFSIRFKPSRRAKAIVNK